MTNIKLNPLLKDFWKAKKPFKILYGGRASSKTEDTAGMIIYLSDTYKLKVACIRKFQSNIRQSVYSVLKRKIESCPYYKERFKFTDNSIVSLITGSEFIFLGWERNTDQIRGLDDVDIMWIEEGHTLTKEQWEIIKPTITIRKAITLIVIVFNPQLRTDFIYENFVLKQRDDTIVQQINYTDNPFLNQSAIEVIEEDKKQLSPEDFEHIYLGMPKSEDELSFIKLTWLNACINSYEFLGIETRGVKKIGYDVADDGLDKCATVTAYGNRIISINEWKAKENELEESATKVYNLAQKENATIVYDCIGVGASAGSTFNRLNKTHANKIIFTKFDAGASVDNPLQQYQNKITNKDHFENLKAQAWQKVSDMALHTYNAVIHNKPYDEDKILSFDKDLPKLTEMINELSIPHKELSNRGLVMVENKKSLKKRGFNSPNIADALIMSLYSNHKVINWGSAKTAFKKTV